MSSAGLQNQKIEQIYSLTQAVEYFTNATNEFQVSYGKLEEQVSKLNLELEEKNKELQSSLKETDSLKNYLDNILTSMNAGVICIDLKNKITMFNCAAEELTGYSRSSVLNKTYHSFFDPENKEFSPEKIVESGKQIVHQQKNITRSDGNVLPVNFSMCLLQSDQGDQIGVVEVFEDLSEIRKLENEIHQIKTLSALGEMAGDVAHEIRNPLGAIAGFGALLERDLGYGDPRQRLVRKILEAVGNMDKIIGNLVFLARPITPNKRKLNLKLMLNDIIETVLFQTNEDGKKINLVRKFPNYPVELMADPQLFQQMFLHIFRNSVESLEESGEIEIELTKIEDKVYIILVDNGRGIPNYMKENIYNPFSGDKSRKPGLGLSIVKKIVDLHKGVIKIDSNEHKGTKLYLEFLVN